MNRKIKFRAWHKKKEEMIYDVQKTEIVHHAMTSMAGEASGLDHYFDEEWFELMQYTGLKDKNGVEIYEGDVIEYCISEPETTTVTFEHGVFWGNYPLYEVVEEKYFCKVIGNIFEGVDK